MFCSSQTGDKLVHNADASAYEFVFCFLAKSCHGLQWHCYFCQAQQGECSCYLNRSRGTESRADGDLSVQQEVGARKRATSLLQNGCHTDHVIAPGVKPHRRQVCKIEFKDFGVFRRAEHKLAIGAGGNGHPGEEPYRTRHYKSVVVVGVLANQVHASRRAENLRLRVEFFLETLG